MKKTLKALKEKLESLKKKEAEIPDVEAEHRDARRTIEQYHGEMRKAQDEDARTTFLARIAELDEDLKAAFERYREEARGVGATWMKIEEVMRESESIRSTLREARQLSEVPDAPTELRCIEVPDPLYMQLMTSKGKPNESSPVRGDHILHLLKTHSDHVFQTSVM